MAIYNSTFAPAQIEQEIEQFPKATKQWHGLIEVPTSVWRVSVVLMISILPALFGLIVSQPASAQALDPRHGSQATYAVTSTPIALCLLLIISGYGLVRLVVTLQNAINQIRTIGEDLTYVGFAE